MGWRVNKFSNDSKTVEAFTTAASSPYSRIDGLFRQLENMGYRTLCTLYHSYIEPIANYATVVWCFRDYPEPQVLHNRIGRFFLGVHWFHHFPATSIQIDFMSIEYIVGGWR